jgi:hypothetical protein
MTTVCLLTPKDEAVVQSAMPGILRSAEYLKATHVAPDVRQRHAVTSTVLQFIVERRRKVYGGYALNTFVEHVSPGAAFYTPETTLVPPDIEFYSPDPLADVVELCDRLHAQGHEYVQGKEAAHANTYTVSVEFVRMCDVTYAPPNVYDAIPSTGMPLVPPHLAPDGGPMWHLVNPRFALIDHLRLLCDPHTSHWRLDRMFPRLYLLQRLFPLPVVDRPLHLPPVLCNAKVVREVRWFFASRSSSCAVVGMVARDFFVPGADSGTHRHVSAVSCAYAEDTRDLKDMLDALDSSPGRSKVQIVKHHPLMDLMGARTVFIFDGEEVATVFDACNRAVPVCGYTCDHMRVASFTYVVMMALACAFLYQTHEDGADSAALFSWLAADLSLARQAHYASTGSTVLDPHDRFRDFGLEFIGRTLSSMRLHMMETDRRLAMNGRHKESVWFTYDPSKSSHQNSRASRRTFLPADGAPECDECPSPRGTVRQPRRKQHNKPLASSTSSVGVVEQGSSASIAKAVTHYRR